MGIGKGNGGNNTSNIKGETRLSNEAEQSGHVRTRELTEQAGQDELLTQRIYIYHEALGDSDVAVVRFTECVYKGKVSKMALVRAVDVCGNEISVIDYCGDEITEVDVCFRGHEDTMVFDYENGNEVE